VRLLLTAGQISDYAGARELLPDLPAATHLLADKGYDANWFRDGLIKRGITPCIPPKTSRKFKLKFDKTLYKQRHKVENMFGRLKDPLSCIATQYLAGQRAPHRHPIRPLRPHILRRNLHRRYRHLVALMSPDPR